MLTGKRVMSGNNVSHSERKTRKKFRPNLCNVTLVSDILGESYRLRVSARALKTVEVKGGFDQFLLSIKDAVLDSKLLSVKKRLESKIHKVSGGA
jgi:large subunit ribosomal protein L28